MEQARITKDREDIFTKVKFLLLNDFPFCDWYAYGSRTQNGTCNKCDFDFMLSLDGSEPSVRAFLEKVGVIGSSAWRYKINQHTGGRSLTGMAYFRVALVVYAKAKGLEAEQYFSFVTVENGKPPKIDLNFNLNFKEANKVYVKI